MNRFLGSIFLFFCGIAAYPQPYIFRNYSIEQGLSQSVVNCIFQDSYGFLWIGTQNGLNRFDGYDFSVFLYNPDDTNSISNNWVFAITEDGHGDLWIGTKGGLNRYIRKENRFQRILHPPGSPEKLSLCAYDVLVSRSGKIYINNPPVLSVFNPGKKTFSHFQTRFRNNGVVNDNRIPLLEDQQGKIWMGSDFGLACFNPDLKKFSYFLEEEQQSVSDPGKRITALCQDSSGTIWIGTARGLFLLNTKKGGDPEVLPFPSGKQTLSSNFIRAIICERKGVVWIGTEGGGLNRILDLNKEKFQIDRYDNQQHGLGHNIVLALAIDHSENLWAGTLQGISKTDLKPAKFKLYRRDNTSSSLDLLGNVIASIYKDENGLIWVGNWGQGLNIINRETGKVEHFSSKLPGNHYIPNDFVHVIFADDHKNIWIGTRDGILVFDKTKRTFVRFREFFRNKNLPDFSGIRIFMIIHGKDNSYWIATQGGLYRIIPEKSQTELFTAESPPDHQIGGNLIYCIHEDHLGLIWIATLNGLDVYNPANGKMTRFRKNESRNSLCDNFVISLCEDRQGDMWIGTGSYVNKFVRKDSTFIYYAKDKGLPNNNIFEILMDHQNTLWFATGGGLCRFDSANGRFRTYSVDEGLQSPEFNLRACYTSPDGEIFLGGMNGFNSFYPGKTEDNPYIPEIIITDCYKSTKDGKVFLDFGSKPEIILDYPEQTFTIDFVALEYTNPDKNQYAYRLEGLSKDWIDIGNRRFVPFSNLPPGEYIFRVKGSNNDGKWNEKGSTLKIIILPPWWRSWWAWTAYIVIIMGILMIYIRIRERKLIQERNLLEKKVQERTLQIENKNQEILHKNEALNQLNSELHALNKTKDKFFSIIAHDLRNPFNSIIGLTDIVLSNLGSNDPEKTKKTICDIRESSKHAFDLLQNLLIWARSQTGTLEFKPVAFDLTELINDNIDLVSGQATRKNISLTVESSSHIMVAGDIQMINTILRNLLTNAIKFTPRDGQVAVSIENLLGFVSILVRDNGIGIAPEILSQLFQVELKQTRRGTEKERGTGLGLILCKEFIEKHGGSISIESEPGKGSCFKITLPDNAETEPGNFHTFAKNTEP